MLNNSRTRFQICIFHPGIQWINITQSLMSQLITLSASNLASCYKIWFIRCCIVSNPPWVHLLLFRYSRPSDCDPGRGAGGDPLQKPCCSALQYQPCGDLLLETVWRWTQPHAELLLASCSCSLPDLVFVTQNLFQLNVSQSVATREHLSVTWINLVQQNRSWRVPACKWYN